MTQPAPEGEPGTVITSLPEEPCVKKLALLKPLQPSSREGVIVSGRPADPVGSLASKINN